MLSTAKIGREKVIPALQASRYCDVLAIASPNRERLVTESERLNIPKIYDTYEELLLDPVIDAVYIPLPNHLHVQWSLKAMEADKHVLCEKPIGMSAAEALELLEASKQKPHLKVMEVFIHRFHPQWIYAKKLVDDGKIGEIKTVQSFFSYYNTDPANIRNRKEVGGGGLMDIGCYCISFARYIFGQEPAKVFGSVEFDPTTNVDRVASGILDFGKGTSTFTCSTQMMPYQRVNIIGTEARIEIEIPVNVPPNKKARIWLHGKTGSEEILFDAIDQYTIQADEFAQAILNDTAVPATLEDAVNNMKVIVAVFRSGKKGAW